MAGASLGEGDEIIATINVTPMVDIMLVLLIIFMLTTSMMQYPVVPVELPRAQNSTDAPTRALAIVVDVDGRLFINGTIRTLDETKSIMESEVRSDPGVNVMLGADGRVKYQSVMEVIDITKTVGIKNLSLNVQFASTGQEGTE